MGKKINTAFGEFAITEEEEKVDRELLPDALPEDPPAGDVTPADPPEEDKTKGDVPTEENPQEDVPEEIAASQFETIADELEKEGVFFLGEDTEYDDSIEGLTSMVKDNMAKFRETVEKEVKEKYNIGEVTEIPEEYYTTLDPEDATHAEILVRDNFKTIGYTDEEVNEAVTDLVSRDKLGTEAKKAKRILSTKEKNFIESEKVAIQARKDNDTAKYTEFVEKTKSEIDSTKELLGFEMDDKMKAGFKSYLFDIGADGKTQAQRNGLDEKRRLNLAFLDYIEANKKSFEIKAKTAAAADLKRKTSRFKPKTAAVTGKTKKEEEKKVDKIDLSILDF